MALIRITSWWDGTQLYEVEATDLKDALHRAVAAKVDLSGSNLSGSNLRGSDLSGSNLTPIRDDFWAVLSAAPEEVSGLLAALKEGRVDGSTYNGECACLVGTIANVRGCVYTALAPVLQANSSRPAEVFFLSIRKGDTPETNTFSTIATEWAEDWLMRMRAAFGQQPEPQTE